MALLTSALASVFGAKVAATPRTTKDKEVYDFCRRVYKETGGATPELRAAYARYRSSIDASRKERIASAG